MTGLFADSGYWIALVDPKDDLHSAAARLSAENERRRIFTTDLVLAEVLNNFSKHGPRFRQAAAKLVGRLRRNQNVTFITDTPALFDKTLERYLSRLDKGWSFTDCTSFIVMEEHGLTEALAHDLHFEQAGFRAHLRRS